MIKNIIELNYEYSKRLEEKLRLLPVKGEYEVNSYLWNDASQVLKKDVYKRMPISSENKVKIRRKDIVPRSHAKEDNDSIQEIRYNLGIKIQTRVKPKLKDYGYLIFPNEGRGIRQRKKGKQEFFDKSLENNIEKIENGLIEHLAKKVKEEIENE